MKKWIFISVATIGLAIGGFAIYNALSGRACSGSKNCSACKNCSGCKYCAKDGGSCGVCK